MGRTTRVPTRRVGSPIRPDAQNLGYAWVDTGAGHGFSDDGRATRAYLACQAPPRPAALLDLAGVLAERRRAFATNPGTDWQEALYVGGEQVQLRDPTRRVAWEPLGGHAALSALLAALERGGLPFGCLDAAKRAWESQELSRAMQPGPTVGALVVRRRSEAPDDAIRAEELLAGRVEPDPDWDVEDLATEVVVSHDDEANARAGVSSALQEHVMPTESEILSNREAETRAQSRFLSSPERRS